MVELDHAFSTGKPAGYNLDAILDLDRIIPCVEGGKVLEARITGEAASMGEGVVATVLDALIKDFTTKLATI